MKCWVLLTILFLGCKTTQPNIQRTLEATNPPLTNTQQTAKIYANEEEIERLKVENAALRLEMDNLKNSSVFLDTSFFKINENGTFTFKSNITFDTLNVKKRMSIGEPALEQIIIGL